MMRYMTVVAVLAAVSSGAWAVQASPGAKAAGMTLVQFQARQEERFMARDSDGDGRISQAEFAAAAKSGRGEPAKRFARLDTNRDGYLDKTELAAMLEHHFHKLDRNGDGVLSPEERSAAHAAHGATTAPD